MELNLLYMVTKTPVKYFLAHSNIVTLGSATLDTDVSTLQPWLWLEDHGPCSPTLPLSAEQILFYKFLRTQPLPPGPRPRVGCGTLTRLNTSSDQKICSETRSRKKTSSAGPQWIERTAAKCMRGYPRNNDTRNVRRMSKEMLKRMSEDMSKEIPEKMLEEMAKGISEMPEKSEQMSQNVRRYDCLCYTIEGTGLNTTQSES